MFRVLVVSTEKCLYSRNITELLIIIWDNIGSTMEIHNAGLPWIHSLHALKKFLMAFKNLV